MKVPLSPPPLLLLLLLFRTPEKIRGFVRVPLSPPVATFLRPSAAGSSFSWNNKKKNDDGPAWPILNSKGDNNGDDTTDDRVRSLRSRIEEQTRASLVEAVMDLSPASPTTVVLNLVGQARLPTTAAAGKKNRTIACAVLSTVSRRDLEEDDESIVPCVLLPLANGGPGRGGGGGAAQLKLLEFAVHDRPVSKTVMLGLNSLLVNRDDALFDGLPWSSWSVDPLLRNRDAAGNSVAPKYHLGKRDAFNRFLGRDWQGKSLAVGNLALRLKYFLEASDKDEGGKEVTSTASDGVAEQITLARRIMELQIREGEMDLAEWDYSIAVCRQKDSSSQELDDLQARRRDCSDDLEATRRRLEELANKSSSISSSRRGIGVGFLTDFLQDVADRTTDYGANAAPYRGAIGYAPMLDSEADIDDSVMMPYSSPYDLMEEILREQLNAEVIGAILENTSLLEGTLAVGGAIILRRKTPTKSVTIAGESLSVDDGEEEFGNQGIRGGETILVECDSDEAIGMALACQVPLRVESGIWERANVMSQPVASAVTSDEGSSSVRSALPLWKAVDPELSILVEGQAGNRSATERVSTLRVPRTTGSLFDSLFEPTSESSSKELFPTDNPVQSLARYDAMSNEDKAVTLMTMSNFDDRLPRPRVVRQQPDVLNKLLLPLVDESVRNQYLIRDAERRGDTAEAEALKREKSVRQQAKERAEQARERGEDDLAEWYDNEADFYGGLRADVTQDEGSYSRFLDRDEWYERSRALQAKKLDRKKFGTLLDGIE